MDEFESLSHGRWECKYHVVFIPKCQRKTLYGTLRKYRARCFNSWPGIQEIQWPALFSRVCPRPRDRRITGMRPRQEPFLLRHELKSSHPLGSIRKEALAWLAVARTRRIVTPRLPASIATAMPG